LLRDKADADRYVGFAIGKAEDTRSTKHSIHGVAALP
jgi:hypothetical protein